MCSYTISDGNGGEDTAVITILVGSVNDPPLAIDDEETTDVNVPIPVDVLYNDADPEGDILQLVGTTTPEKGGSVAINEQTRNLEYT